MWQRPICHIIVTQLSAIRAALRRVEEEVLKDHVSHCVEHAASGDKSDQRKKIAELMAVIGAGRTVMASQSSALAVREFPAITAAVPVKVRRY
jgi:metal-sensitive transcriptional repressor